MSTNDKLTEALRLGQEGAPATEDERLLFEAWMRGHCWALCATWNGKQYVSDAERDGLGVDPRAMNTRQLFAAWRDRGALAAYEAEAKPAPAPAELACDIQPRPLAYSLADYHRAMSEGPLHYTWQDKPHRLVYDLIAAVRYYAAPAAPAMPNPGSPEASAMIDSVMAEYNWPSNTKNAARAGYVAATRLMAAPAAPAEPTLEMLKAGAAEWLKYGEREACYPLAQGFDKLTPEDAIRRSRLTHVYRAMLAAPAAPAPHPDTKDAERYRWLRGENNDSAAAVVRDYGIEDPAELDAFIDAAIAASKGGGNG